MTKNSVVFALSLSLLILAGCGGKVGLTGRVVFSDDGSPLTMGMVFFETPTFLARGILQPDGTFTVGSLQADDGLPPGKYRVYITGAVKSLGQDATGTEIFESLIDEKFAHMSTSDLEIEITSSMKGFVIEVDRYKPAPRRRR